MRKKRRVKTILIIVFAIIAVLAAGVVGASLYFFGNINTTDISENNEDLGISDERAAQSDAKIKNYALFGVDTRNMSSDSGRSDAIIILTVDERNNVIKMTSILRDSKVAIEGHGNQKITHAYAFGGPTLAIKTINQNFDMDIKDYITVNFSQMAEIVDSVGGVTMDLTASEVAQVNKTTGNKLQGSGSMELNGEQAVAFSRIRKIDSDNARADRQKEVLSAVFRKIASLPKSQYPGVIHDLLGTVETSLTYGDLIGYTISPLTTKGFTTEQYSIPDKAYETDLNGGIDSTGAWVWTYNLDNAAKRLHTIVYGE